MESYSQNTHPNSVQLAGYMESPESGEYKPIRKHLMACDHCRVRVDKLVQLELDIKHFVPRLGQHQGLDDLQNDSEQNIERYIDGQTNPVESQSVKRQLGSNPQALKAALHYAVNSAAMSRNIDTTDTSIDRKALKDNNSPNSFGSFFNKLRQYLQWPTPAWAMVPAVLVVATVVSSPLIYLSASQQNTGVFIAEFQDNPVISYSSADIPKGSIGFFHDAKSSAEPFNGMDIIVTPNQTLNFNWQAIPKAKSYQFKVYEFSNGQKQELTTLESNEPNASPDSIIWENGKHYQWQISGVTQDGLQYTTNGDFLFIRNN